MHIILPFLYGKNNRFFMFIFGKSAKNIFTITRKEVFSMVNVSSVCKGVAVGMAAGVVTYALTNATKNEKRRFKSNTVKAMHSVGNMMDILGAMFM